MNPYSWNKVANVLYVEQPAGVGFSYSDDESDYVTGDAQAAADNYVLIKQFFERFPERKSNQFYISSESYGGHYIPECKYSPICLVHWKTSIFRLFSLLTDLSSYLLCIVPYNNSDIPNSSTKYRWFYQL